MTTSPHAAEQSARHPLAPTRDPQEPPELALELVNVARTMFGLLLPQPEAAASPSPSEPITTELVPTESVPSLPASVAVPSLPATVAVPSLPATVAVPSLPVPPVPLASVPVPSVAASDLPASPVPSPDIRPTVPRSMALLSEVGFLDD